MRRLLAPTALLAALASPVRAQLPASASAAAPSDTMPAAVVQRFVEAANARDAAAMAALVAPDAVFARFPGAQTLVQGRDSIHAFYARRLAPLPRQFRITVRPRIVEGSLVVDQEHFAGTTDGRRQATWMYEVQGGLIRRAWTLDGGPTREVRADTLLSHADPAATFVFSKPFEFAGSQTIDILEVAGADQFFFIDAAEDRSIRRFYWVQFEHYYPTNDHTYDFSSMNLKPVPIGRLTFMGDVRVRDNYFTMDKRPGSDSQAAATFLRARGFKIEGTFATLRLFHLPDASRRRELMIIYGESVPAGTSASAIAPAITARAQASLTAPL